MSRTSDINYLKKWIDNNTDYVDPDRVSEVMKGMPLRMKNGKTAIVDISIRYSNTIRDE